MADTADHIAAEIVEDKGSGHAEKRHYFQIWSDVRWFMGILCPGINQIRLAPFASSSINPQWTVRALDCSSVNSRT